ncbi:Sulfotransferase family protein [Tistlia consotensis]|uniref:Sulfotransferase family protein n=1 Tax=Tistlia consotensis USBA 355 TaxID=560819 RepID=A0A1Y6C9W8_9PROT|nr:sulfotransferase [Tistlia consotensis]SMF41768.1 Sulfotransferase family protein [Tistlia consotensis USBA 355]SNR73449.1 Sulfotransferase family protein [Tistlia consotensis]
MTTAPADSIAPVLVLSTGRCGSTMVSDLLSRHPQVLSLSEFFVPLGAQAFAWQRPDGERMWRILTRQNTALHAMLKDGKIVEENLYRYGTPGARFSPGDVPPILAVTLPHLTDRPDELHDELEPVVRNQPRQPLAEHYRHLFGHLMARFGRQVWVERSGGSLMHAAKLLRLFPEARVVHVFRDGRDTAISMGRHHNFRVLLGAILKVQSLGYDARRAFLKSKGSLLEVWIHQQAFRLLDVGKLAARPTLTDFGAFWSDMELVGRQVLGTLPPERQLSLRFEDVLSAPRETLAGLIRFIDPSLEDAAWLDEVSAIPRTARSKYLELPESERQALTSACAPGLELLGYAL